MGNAENVDTKEIFTDPGDAQKQFETMPAWEPHSLAEKVAKYEVPEKLQNQKRTQSITVNYGKATNTDKMAGPPRTGNQARKRATITQTPHQHQRQPRRQRTKQFPQNSCTTSLTMKWMTLC
jgi:hypothetical protein